MRRREPDHTGTAQVCRFLHPSDMLSLARSSKDLRAFFMSKLSKPCWDAAWSLQGIPTWRGVAAPQAAEFLFSMACQVRVKSLYSLAIADMLLLRVWGVRGRRNWKPFVYAVDTVQSAQQRSIVVSALLYDAVLNAESYPAL